VVSVVDMKALKEDALHIFQNGFACSESVIYALRKHFELDMSDDAIAMSTGFPWGLGGAGCLCGAVAGGTMCLGFLYGRRIPGDPCIVRCHELTLEFAQAIKERFGSFCCGKLIASYPDRNAPERKSFCCELVAFAVEKAAAIICREEGIELK